MALSVCRWLVLFLVTGVSTYALAATEAEYQALRSWCVQRLQHRNDAAWQAANNPQKYFHFHHYCNGMKWESVLIAPRDGQQRNNVVSEIVDQTSYVITHAEPTHPLLPEVYVLRGRAMHVGRRYAEAEADLLNALRIDSRHTRASSYLATLYLDTNRRLEAAEVVRAGLSRAPGDRRLRQMGKELKIELPPEAPPPVVEGASPESADTIPREAAHAESQAATDSDAGTNLESGPETREVPASGCRFCPPEEIQNRWRESFRDSPKR